MSNSSTGKNSTSAKQQENTSFLRSLEKIYSSKIKVVEQTYAFDTFNSPSLSVAEIQSKPIILLLGQYSTGKTSFIKHLLEKEYPGTHIGPEPTTDRFVAVMGASSDRIIPGNAASSQADKPFRGLEKFGNSFLSKFQISETDSPILDKVTFIDSPGVLSGEKQRIGRSYDFVSVCEWFAERADMILLIFDAYKLDISDEFKRVMGVLRGQDDKIRIVLNKSSVISPQQLMRVYGALMWSLGKVIETPEVIRVYIGSFLHQSEAAGATGQEYFNKELIKAEHADLISDILQLPKNALIRKVNTIVRRARLARVHAYLMGYLKAEMPSLFGKSAKQAHLMNNLEHIFEKVQRMHNLACGDFPDVAKFRETLKMVNINDFSKLSSRQMNLIEEALTKDLPTLLLSIPTPKKPFKIMTKNPFSLHEQHSIEDEQIIWMRKSVNFSEYNQIFEAFPEVDTARGKISGQAVKEFFMESGLSNEELSAIWNLADRDADGFLCKEEFSLAMHLVKARISGHEIPLEIPASLIQSSSALEPIVKGMKSEYYLAN